MILPLVIWCTQFLPPVEFWELLYKYFRMNEVHPAESASTFLFSFFLWVDRIFAPTSRCYVMVAASPRWSSSRQNIMFGTLLFRWHTPIVLKSSLSICLRFILFKESTWLKISKIEAFLVRPNKDLLPNISPHSPPGKLGIEWLGTKDSFF